MSSNSERGYERILADYESLVNHCLGFGPAYNPANPLIQVPALQASYTAAAAAFQNIITARTAYANATNAREIHFTTLNKLATRVINALIGSGAPQSTIDDARTIVRKIRGERATRKPRPDPEAIPLEGAPSTSEITRTISVSQQSFDAKVGHLARLIETVTTAPMYTPFESDLSAAGLNTLINLLRVHNTSVNNALVAYENARVEREKVLRNETSGIISTGKAAKGYIKSVFGIQSMEYLQVSKLRFI